MYKNFFYHATDRIDTSNLLQQICVLSGEVYIFSINVYPFYRSFDLAKAIILKVESGEQFRNIEIQYLNIQ